MAEASDNTANESLNESKLSEAGTDGEPSSTKKPKKDKVKRLFSLRSLSFGRKDKQKPKKAAKEEAAAATTEAAAVEGAEGEKVSQVIYEWGSRRVSNAVLGPNQIFGDLLGNICQFVF